MDGGDSADSPPKFKARLYNGSPMTPRVIGYANGGAPIVVDLRGVRVSRNGNGAPVLYAHDRLDPIGHTTRVDVLANAITGEGLLSVPGPNRDRVAGGAKGGFRWAISIGYRATEMEYIGRNESANVNGRVVRGPAHIARKGDLFEISFLAIGAEPSASATVSATSGDSQTTIPTPEPILMNPELRAYIEAAGFSPDELETEQVELFRKQHEATIEAEPGSDLPRPDGPAPVQPVAPSVVIEAGDGNGPVAEMRAAAAAESRRVARVVEICAQYGNPTTQIQGNVEAIQAIAIEAGWDADKTELEAMRAARPTAPSARSTGRSHNLTIEAMQAGLMMRTGVDVESRHFRGVAAIEAGLPSFLRADVNSDGFGKAMDAARDFRTASLVEIAAAAVEMETGRVIRGKSTIIEAAFSSTALASIFGVTIGARVLQTFQEVGDSTMGWTRRSTVPDFEPHVRAGLESMQSLSHQPPGKAAEHAKVSDKNEIVQAARYSKQIVIDEQHLMGDRLDLLSTVPQAMARAAGRLIPDLVYFLILSNPTMLRTGRDAFHETDGTLILNKPFNKANLSLAISQLMKRKDGDATLNLQPSHLISGTELADDVVQLTGSAIFTNDSGAGARNPLARYGITPVADARFSNGVKHPMTGATTTGSGVDWLLVSTDSDGVEVQTVDGSGGVPRVRTKQLDGGLYGIQSDVCMDAAAKIVENRTLEYVTGSA